jgi:hypothetical protein
VHKLFLKIILVGSAFVLLPFAGSANTNEGGTAFTGKHTGSQIGASSAAKDRPCMPSSSTSSAGAGSAGSTAVPSAGRGKISGCSQSGATLFTRRLLDDGTDLGDSPSASFSGLPLGSTSSSSSSNGANGSGNGSAGPAPVPEPSPILLFGTGLLLVGCLLRRRITAHKEI